MTSDASLVLVLARRRRLLRAGGCRGEGDGDGGADAAGSSASAAAAAALAGDGAPRSTAMTALASCSVMPMVALVRTHWPRIAPRLPAARCRSSTAHQRFVCGCRRSHAWISFTRSSHMRAISSW